MCVRLRVVAAELRAACSKERKTGKAPPKRLTTHQRQIVERLIAAHGDDVQVCETGGLQGLRAFVEGRGCPRIGGARDTVSEGNGMLAPAQRVLITMLGRPLHALWESPRDCRQLRPQPA